MNYWHGKKIPTNSENKPYKWVVPVTGDYTFEVAGAKGADSTLKIAGKNVYGYGTKGAIVTGTVKLTAGTELYLYVGKRGSGKTGGWNGGGSGRSETYINTIVGSDWNLNETFSTYCRGNAGGGGGASDIRLSGMSANNRILVAPGGGGAGTSIYISLMSINTEPEIDGVRPRHQFSGGHQMSAYAISNPRPANSSGVTYVTGAPAISYTYLGYRVQGNYYGILRRLTITGGAGGGYRGGRTTIVDEYHKEYTNVAGLKNYAQDGKAYAGTAYYDTKLFSNVSGIGNKIETNSVDYEANRFDNNGNGYINITLEAIKEFALTVNPNGGTWEGKTTNTEVFLETGAERTIANPTRKGYTFQNWTRTGAGSKLEGTKFTMGTEDATLKANWTINQSTLVVNPNGGTWNTFTTQRTYTQNYNTTLNIPVPTRAGYIFAGWERTNTNGTMSSLTTNAIYTFGEAKGVTDTIKAKWSTIEYTITYQLNGGTVTGNPTRYTPETSTITLKNPTKTGYTFAGWTGSNGTTAQITVTIPKGSTGNKNYIAQWTPITYQIKYNGNAQTSGTMANSTHTYNVAKNLTANAYKREYKVTYNYKHSGQANTEVMARATFNGWATSASGAKVYNNSQSVINLRNTTGVVNLYANWTLARVTLPSPTRKGYTFKGWSTSSNAETINYKGGDTYTPTRNTTLYAVWEAHTTKVTITKKDSITGEKLNGATFGLYEWNGSTYIKKNTLIDNGNGTYTTQVMTYTDTNQGKYKIIEEKAPTYYTNARTEKELIIAEAGYHEYNYNITNEPNKIKIQAIKVDSETRKRISGATFTIYEWNKEKGAYEIYTKSNTLEFQGDRSYLSGWLYANRKNEGKFRIIETGTPNGYYGDYNNGNKKNNDITISATNNGQTIKITNGNGEYSNTRVKGTINVNKIDKETNRNLSQGDGTLDGAIYGLYAAENINHKDTVTGKIYNKDQEVKRATIRNGSLKFENVEIGKYYIKEITAPKGYIQDQTKYEISVNYEGETVAQITRNITVKEQVKKQAFRIKKVSSNSSTTELPALEGAGFKIYLIRDLEGVKNGTIKKQDNAGYKSEDFIGYDFSKEQTALDYSKNQNGERTPEIFSNRQGEVTSPELAYGQYVVIESTVPEDRKPIEPFIVTIEEDNRTPQAQRVLVDEEFEALIKVIKKDTQTKQTVLNKNAKYRIWSVTQNKYIEYTVSYPTIIKYGTEENPYQTNEKGEFITPLRLQIGEYELREIGAPDGYILTGYEGKMKEGTYKEQPKEPVKFKVKMNTAYYEDPETKEIIINVEQYNDEMFGELEITKTGEYLQGAETRKDGTIDPIYQKRQIEGAEFEIYAKEDIYTIDNQGTKLCEKDQLVKKITTNAQGKAYIDNLPIGKYYIKEVKTVEGFVLNKEPKEFEVSYQGEKTAVQKIEISYKNERQKINLNGNEENGETGIIKKDQETGEKLEGAIIGIYSKEDITGENGIIIPKDTLIEKVITDKNGKAKYTIDLPLGKYYLKEIQAPIGYILNEQTIEIDGSYKGQEIEQININQTIENKSRTVQIEKIDQEGNPLKGAKLEIIEETRQIDTWETTEQAHEIRKLEAGKTYILKEIEPPKGYVTADEIQFQTNEQGQIYYYNKQAEKGISLKEYKQTEKIEMKDQKTKTKIEIVDKETGEPIPGITVQIKDKETGEIIYEYETGEAEKIIEGLPLGEYEIITKDTEERGYTTEQKDLNIKDTKEEQGTKIEQDYTKIEITLRDEETKELIEGKIQIIDKDGKIIKELETEKGKIQINRLPIGEYTIHQTEAQKGYFEAEDIKIEIKDTGELQKYEILNKKKVVNYGIEKTIEKITINGKNLEISNNKLTKIELKASEIKNAQITVDYNIKVSNTGEMEGKVRILEKLPNGCEVIEATGEWKIIREGELEKEVELQAGESKEIKLSLRWINKEINLGTQTNKAKLENTEDMNSEDNISEATIVISVKTGIVVSAIIIIIIISSLGISGYMIIRVINKKEPNISKIRFLNK